MNLVPPFRRATPADAAAMADLVNMAGEGLPLYLWSKTVEAGESPWDVGRRRAQRENGGFSYRNAIMMDEGGRSAACLIGYPLPERPEPIDYDTMPPMFVGMQELENLAPGTWYVNVLAAYPEYRGKAYGTRLLGLAEEIGADAGVGGMSIIVADTNRGARRLYERCGYREVARRAMVKEAWENPGRSWVLLTKSL